MQGADVERLLARVPFLADVTTADRRALGRLASTRSYERGALVCNQQEPGDALFIIARGSVRVVLYGESGKEITLSLLTPGDFFGEMSLLDGQPRSASVVTTEPALLVVLKREDFRQHLLQNPATALAVLEELSRRLRKADEIIGSLAMMDVYGRVARMLMELGEREGQQVEEGILIKRRPTQQEIASMVNTSRETVSRALNEFRKRGLLVLNGRRVLLRPQFYSEVF